MAKLENEPTVASVWPNSQSFADRAQRAVPDTLLRDIVADGSRSHYPQPKAELREAPRSPQPPGYVEWCRLRLGVEWSYERARDYYLTARTAGKDVGPAVDERATKTPHRGWIDPPKVADWRPDGLGVMEQMLAQEDRHWRADLARKLGK